MQAISYRGHCIAVVVHGDMAVFASELETRRFDDPLLRFVAAMCRFAMEIERGQVSDEYEDALAESYARELVMPADEHAPIAWLPDVHLARWFAVPVEQVGVRRLELYGNRCAARRPGETTSPRRREDYDG